MQKRKPVVVGIGELLWDLLPGGSHLGGAPANFAYIAHLLGASAFVVSRVGNDELGRRARRMLEQRGLNLSCLQTDEIHSTGTTRVTLHDAGAAQFEIVDSVAWDFLEWSPELAELAAQTDAVCFGTLAQRGAATGHTIRTFLEHTPSSCLKIFDVNLRPPFVQPEHVAALVPLCNVLKMNEQELPAVLHACDLPSADVREAVQALRRRFGLRAVCVTRGAEGSLLATADEIVERPAAGIKVADTIGAGDAYTAAITIQLLAGHSPEQVITAGNELGAWVASRPGAMPKASEAERRRLREMYGVAAAGYCGVNFNKLPEE
jgi:fructokinase